MAKPTPPTGVIVHGITDDGSELVTKVAGTTITVSAIVNDPDSADKVSLVVRYSPNKDFSHWKQVLTTFGARGARRSAVLTGLSKNTLYYGRAYTRDNHGNYSTNYNAFKFWMDRYPSPAELVTPADGTTQDPAFPITFDWIPHDPDETDPAPVSGYQFAYRIAGTPLYPPGPWLYTSASTTASTFDLPAHTLQSSSEYEWRLRTRDPQNQWGDFSVIRSFSTTGITNVPLLLAPAADTAIFTDLDNVFRWQFRDPDPATSQANANLRYRVIGTSTWIEIDGSALTDSQWVIPAGTLAPGYHYEWQVQTVRNTGGFPFSDWSPSGKFWSTLTPGSLSDIGEVIGAGVRGQLGHGTYRAFIFDQGGTTERFEITPFSSLQWTRLRDDIGSATIQINDADSDLGKSLGKVDSWAHELVVYRDDDRVFEGPVVQPTWKRGQVTLVARDVMAYLYRRILRQGYNDSYHLVGGVQLGLKTVVERAGLIAVNALSYHDPNVLAYLTLISTGDDARQSRIIPDFTKTAWEEIDDMASNAGLDYTAIGRRIILWDTHTQIGQLPEMRDGDFTDDLIVSQYGMSAANFWATTDGQGNWGAAIPEGTTEDDWFQYYGPLEQLASGYGDTAPAAATGVDVSLDPAALAALQDQLRAQSKRSISGRWPAPMVARVPDNAGLNPTANVTINQLVPGVWVPLRAEATDRPFAQMQKLDSVSVTVASPDSEKVSVVLSPAPRGSEDPDSTGTDDAGVGTDA